MKSNTTSNKSINEHTKKMYVRLNIDHKSREDVKLLENFTHNINRFGSNTLVLHLNELPQYIDHLTSNLNELKVNNCDASELYEIQCHLGDLNKLFFCETIKSVPNQITQLLNLNILNLSNNQLTEVPDNFSNLKNLEILNLKNNKLKNLPNSYWKLKRLKYLDISGNNFKVLPNCISNGMGTLKILNISENRNIKMNIIPYSKYLEVFHARYNKICDKFPDWVLSSKFFNLKEFDLEGTFFNIFNFVGKGSNSSITYFSMSCSSLTNSILEKMIQNMVKLEKINVGNKNTSYYKNSFNSIPIHEMRNQSIIREINFCMTSLPSVPNSINQLHYLKKLDISLNNIPWLPEEFCELYELESLKINGNGLIMFPKHIGNLKLLREIRAENNLLTQLPDSFKDLKNLNFVDLYNNMFEEFPDVLYETENLQGLDLEQNFFTTDNIKIRGISYSVLRETYSSLIEINSEMKYRCSGSKIQSPNKIEDSNSLHAYLNFSDEEENDKFDNVFICKSSDIEENWESVSDLDEEFVPGLEINYNMPSNKYTLDVSNGFCPADLHSKKISAEVASMCQYGSLSTFVVEHGQFDDE